jgi:hypothetical protein
MLAQKYDGPTSKYQALFEDELISPIVFVFSQMYHSAPPPQNEASGPGKQNLGSFQKLLTIQKHKTLIKHIQKNRKNK